ncbi:unnamed protein product [Caenorhabditis auriculariae]|uniref:Uncharacterized protein n=1 Tax=Caenorhabditis auriculariae TaxID=2777116 RepID=A0A8S1HSF1_9PELO|nr:unnamed protein product [Caenorhabditis auriculariae]
MAPRAVFVTGASRGIGLGIVKAFLEDPSVEIVIAGARNVDGAVDLKKIQEVDERLHIVQLDVVDDESIDNALVEIDKIVGEAGLNVLVNNAGIIVPYRAETAPDRAKIETAMSVNATSPLILSQKIAGRLQKAANYYFEKTGDDSLSANRAAIVNIGSDSSSMALNDGSGQFEVLAHRMSKTALLSFTRTLAMDYKKAEIPILVTCLHPGWVDSELGGPEAPVTVKESTGALVKSIFNLTETHAGRLFERDLTPMPF